MDAVAVATLLLGVVVTTLTIITIHSTMFVHDQQDAMGDYNVERDNGDAFTHYTAKTTATSRSEFEGRWQNFHLNSSRVQVLSFDASVGAAGATATFVIVGEGRKCAPPHALRSSLPNFVLSGSNCVPMEPNDLYLMSAQEIDAVLFHETHVVFRQLGVFELSHNLAWTWRLVGTTVVRAKATFEVSVTMTSAALSSEINRNAGTPVVASAACGNSTHSHRSGNAAITCEVEFVSFEAAVKAAASGNANALMSVYSSTTEEGDLSSTTTDGIAHMSVMVSMLCVCAVWALLQL